MRHHFIDLDWIDSQPPINLRLESEILKTFWETLIGNAAVNSVKLNWLADFCRPPG